LLKIVWGTFAFPWMYRAEFFRAVGAPLAVLIAATLLWEAGAYSGTPGFARGLSYTFYLFAFSWLAIRCHRLVLLGSDEATPPWSARATKSIGIYLATMAGMWSVGVFLVLILASIVIAIFGSRYVPSGSGPPPFDPDVQTAVDRASRAATVVALYFAARLCPLLPAIALEERWDPLAAWRISRGNGWRLFAVVFLLPMTFNFTMTLFGSADPGGLRIAVLVIVSTLLTSLGVVSMSLSYRELAEPPAPPPTPPPG